MTFGVEKLNLTNHATIYYAIATCTTAIKTPVYCVYLIYIHCMIRHLYLVYIYAPNTIALVAYFCVTCGFTLTPAFSLIYACVGCLLPRAREARTRGRVIGVSVGCLFVCLFVDTKTSSLSETGQFMSSTYYVPVRNRKILASTYLTNESVRQGAEKSRIKIFSLY